MDQVQGKLRGFRAFPISSGSLGLWDQVWQRGSVFMLTTSSSAAAIPSPDLEPPDPHSPQTPSPPGSCRAEGQQEDPVPWLSQESIKIRFGEEM